MKKVVVTGSESSGKTELAHRIGQHYGAAVGKEFVRGFAQRLVGKISFEDHGMIAKGQMAAENEAILSTRGPLVVLDTDLVSTVVYCEHYFGRCPVWIADQARARLADLYLLMRPDIPWVPDGVRDRGDRRDEMHGLFAATLKSLGARVVEVGGERDARFAVARQAIDSLLTAGDGASM